MWLSCRSQQKTHHGRQPSTFAIYASSLKVDSNMRACSSSALAHPDSANVYVNYCHTSLSPTAHSYPNTSKYHMYYLQEAHAEIKTEIAHTSFSNRPSPRSRTLLVYQVTPTQTPPKSAVQSTIHLPKTTFSNPDIRPAHYLLHTSHWLPLHYRRTRGCGRTLVSICKRIRRKSALIIAFRPRFYTRRLTDS